MVAKSMSMLRVALCMPCIVNSYVVHYAAATAPAVNAYAGWGGVAANVGVAAPAFNFGWGVPVAAPMPMPMAMPMPVALPYNYDPGHPGDYSDEAIEDDDVEEEY